MTESDIEILLNNYQNGVQKIIPAYLTGKMADEEAWADELALVLHSRDELEWAFAVSPLLWQQYANSVDELDRLLLAMKEAILAHTPAYTTFRRQFPRPRSHWWYYFDDIIALPAQPTGDAEPSLKSKGYWMPVVSLKAAT
jgi:hypothetical protein